MGKFKEIDNVELRLELNDIYNNLDYTFIDYNGNTCKLCDVVCTFKFITYSKRLYGGLRYNKKDLSFNPILILALFEDEKGKTPRGDDEIIDTFIHELAHLIQYKKGELLYNGEKRDIHGVQFRIYENELKESYKRYLKEDV